MIASDPRIQFLKHSILQGNLFRALKEFKRDKISRQNARLSLANCVYDNPSLPRRKLMLSVGGNNYRPPLERSKSAPKLMAIEEAEDDDEEREEEQYTASRSVYSGSMGRRSWLNRNSVSVVEATEEEEEDEEDHESICHEPKVPELEGHEIDQTVQENSFKLTPSISRFEGEEDEEEDHEKVGGEATNRDCDKETEGLEGEIMSYFEKKLNERSVPQDDVKEGRKSIDCQLDTDDIISQLIRNQPPSRSSLASMTSPAASEPDEPESNLRYQIEDLDSDVDSDQRRFSPSMESDDSTRTRRNHLHHHYPSKGIQESALQLDLPKKGYGSHQGTDSDSDVSDESGFIEYHQEHHRYPISADINKADNSILV